MRPEPRRTLEAVEQVRAVYPNAYIVQQSPRLSGGGFLIYSGAANISRDILGRGPTRKSAWWDAVPKALEKALTT